jgi:hypothetical protein
MGEKGPKTYIRKISTKKPARESEISNLLLCCVVCALFGRKKELSAGRGSVFCVVLFSPSCSCSCSFSRFACTTWSACVYIYSRREVGVLALYSSSASDASVCIGTPVLFGVV